MQYKHLDPLIGKTTMLIEQKLNSNASLKFPQYQNVICNADIHSIWNLFCLTCSTWIELYNVTDLFDEYEDYED